MGESSGITGGGLMVILCEVSLDCNREFVVVKVLVVAGVTDSCGIDDTG